jgi:glycosyltransferase involved in cell wall biosynthesis
VVFLFVGSVCLRKGVAQLLEAWSLCGAPGRLRFAGAPTPEIKPFVDRYRHLESVEFVGFTDDVGALYATADVFVFPTFEEGGPKVTYEAAGCGLPVITTPMGAGRIVEDLVNGLIVAAGDVGALASAISVLAGSSAMRRLYGERARADAARYTYEAVARDRALKLAGALGVGAREPVAAATARDSALNEGRAAQVAA